MKHPADRRQVLRTTHTCRPPSSVSLGRRLVSLGLQPRYDLPIDDIDDLEKDGLDVDLRILKCLVNFHFVEALVDGFFRRSVLSHAESFVAYYCNVMDQTWRTTIVGRDTIEFLPVCS